MKKLSVWLALAGWFVSASVHAISLDDIQLWTGSGTNRAALVIEWNSPEIFNTTTVAAPVANKTMVWGYRFNGQATGTQMFTAILASDPKLYAAADVSFGTFIESIGYNLSGNGNIGITDGMNTNYFTNGYLTDATVDVDAAAPLNRGDLFWSGDFGPNWQVWNEAGDSGGFENSPNRGTNAFSNADTGEQGQWAFANFGLDELVVTNGSWLGFSVSAAGFPDNTSDPDYTNELNAFNNDEQAPPSPDGTYVAFIANTNDFAVEVISTNGIDPDNIPYNDPTTVLNPPPLNFVDNADFPPEVVTDRVSIIDPPFNVAPDGSNVITEISSGGQITVKLGRKVYHDPNNPYATDLIVYGYSFFTGISGPIGSAVSDATDLSAVRFDSRSSFGHDTVVSVSEDNTNWYSYDAAPALFPDDAYRWDDTNSSWTLEEMNPNKPLNPYIYTNNFAGETVAGVADQFVGASGGTGYNLAASGLPWIQYVRITPAGGDYTVIDAIAAVNPVTIGDALAVSPNNLTSGITNLVFQNPDNSSQSQISISFDSVNEVAKISTVSLQDFSSFAPVEGTVSSAYQIQALPITGTSPVSLQANVGLRTGNNYSGSGNDLRVFQWENTNWLSQVFTYNASNQEVLVAGVTNFSAFVVSQIVPPSLNIQPTVNGFSFQFTPVPNCPETLQRSTDLVTWTPIYTFTATNNQPVTLQDSDAPAGQAFYRVQLDP
jgi:hypothetical protein